MSTKHKHADLIIQWALGAKIEAKHILSNFWASDPEPTWGDEYEYRIEYQPDPDVVVYASMHKSYTLDVIECILQGGIYLCGSFNPNRQPTDNIKVTYSGETGKLISIEMIEQE